MLFEKKKTLKAADSFIKSISEIPEDIRRKTIILIGPQGAGKSTVSRILREFYPYMDRISLDNRDKYASIYKKRRLFKDYKNFELTLTGCLLSSLKKPSIIDFGAGHSVYEDPALDEKLRKMCSYFPNIYLLIPSRDEDASLKTLAKRLNLKPEDRKYKEIKRFLGLRNNERIATHIIYESGKNPMNIAEEIVDKEYENDIEL